MSVRTPQQIARDLGLSETEIQTFSGTPKSAKEKMLESVNKRFEDRPVPTMESLRSARDNLYKTQSKKDNSAAVKAEIEERLMNGEDSDDIVADMASREEAEDGDL